MKKIVIIVLVILCSACKSEKNAANVVKDYLDEYRNLSLDVKKNIDVVINDNENFNKSHKAMYKKILINQYKTLKYNIISEEYDNNSALITVNINVKDLNVAESKALEYLSTHLKEFYNEDNTFDTDKYISYKLDLMYKEDSRINYEIVFYLEYKNNNWVLTQPTDEDLEKIHGIYIEDNVT